MYYVYLLKDKRSKKIYIGYSNNLKRRLSEHLNKNVYTTRRMKYPTLIYYESYLSSESAKNREKKLKQYGASFQELKKRVGRS